MQVSKFQEVSFTNGFLQFNGNHSAHYALNSNILEIQLFYQ